MAQINSVESPSIASHVRVCLRGYEQMLGIFDTSQPHIKQKLPPRSINDSLGRFRLWVGNLGAHRQGRSSIDYKLREASHIRNRVIKLLQRMQSYQQEVIQILSGERVSGEDLSDSDSDMSDLIDDHLESEYPSELQQLVSNINEVSVCLMRLALAIRNPAPHDQFKSSTKIDVSHFEAFDIDHVRGKFPFADDFIIHRLGKAISRRRQYLRYREEHRKKLEQGLEANTTARQEKVENASSDVEASMVDHKTEEIQSTVASSIPYIAKLSTSVEDLENNEDFEESLSQTSYASSAYDASKLRPPPLPEAGHDGDPFECPLCCRITSVRQVQTWYKHVYRDLQPYVCTFEHCSLGDHIYESRHDWFQHELQYHRNWWGCLDGCNRSFQDKESIQQHLLEDHIEFKGLAQSRLEAIMRTCERQATLDRQGQCPLCRETMPTLTQLPKHLGKHHEELALFALPSHLQGEDEDDASGNSASSALSVQSAASVQSEPTFRPFPGLQTINTDLARACERGDIDAANRTLRVNFAQIEYMDSRGYTLLHRATSSAHKDLVDYLLKQGCNPRPRTSDGNTPLMLAAMYAGTDDKHSDIFKCLLMADPKSLHLENDENLTAVDIIREKTEQIRDSLFKVIEEVETVTLIERDDAEYEQDDEHFDRDGVLRPPVGGTIAAAKSGDVNVLTTILEKGFNADMDTGRYSETPMTAAIKHKQLEIVKLLLSQDGFDPTRRDGFDRTYFDLATEHGWEEGTHLLRRAFEEHCNATMSHADMTSDVTVLHAKQNESVSGSTQQHANVDDTDERDHLQTTEGSQNRRDEDSDDSVNRIYVLIPGENHTIERPLRSQHSTFKYSMIREQTILDAKLSRNIEDINHPYTELIPQTAGQGQNVRFEHSISLIFRKAGSNTTYMCPFHIIPSYVVLEVDVLLSSSAFLHLFVAQTRMDRHEGSTSDPVSSIEPRLSDKEAKESVLRESTAVDLSISSSPPSMAIADHPDPKHPDSERPLPYNSASRSVHHPCSDIIYGDPSFQPGDTLDVMESVEGRSGMVKAEIITTRHRKVGGGYRLRLKNAATNELLNGGAWFDPPIVKELSITTWNYEHEQKKSQGVTASLLSLANASSSSEQVNTVSAGDKLPIKLRDIYGRDWFFPWRGCKTWEGVQQLINKAFESSDDPMDLRKHVLDGHYDLFSPYTQMIPPLAWPTVIQPGWTITMHLSHIVDPNEEKNPEVACSFVSRDGERCVNLQEQHFKGHQNADGKIIGPGLYESDFVIETSHQVPSAQPCDARSVEGTAGWTSDESPDDIDSHMETSQRNVEVHTSREDDQDETYSDIPSAHSSLYLTQQDGFEDVQSSPLLNSLAAEMRAAEDSGRRFSAMITAIGKKKAKKGKKAAEIEESAPELVSEHPPAAGVESIPEDVPEPPLAAETRAAEDDEQELSETGIAKSKKKKKVKNESSTEESILGPTAGPPSALEPEGGKDELDLEQLTEQNSRLLKVLQDRPAADDRERLKNDQSQPAKASAQQLRLAAEYQNFLETERRIVETDQWEHFPVGSRLSIRPLPAEAKLTLFERLSRHGELIHINIRQPFGFVQYFDSDSSQRALDAEQGSNICGQKVHIEVATLEYPGGPRSVRARTSAERGKDPSYTTFQPPTEPTSFELPVPDEQTRGHGSKSSVMMEKRQENDDSMSNNFDLESLPLSHTMTDGIPQYSPSAQPDVTSFSPQVPDDEGFAEIDMSPAENFTLFDTAQPSNTANFFPDFNQLGGQFDNTYLDATLEAPSSIEPISRKQVSHAGPTAEMENFDGSLPPSDQQTGADILLEFAQRNDPALFVVHRPPRSEKSDEHDPWYCRECGDGPISFIMPICPSCSY